jgi:hypothetical protein
MREMDSLQGTHRPGIVDNGTVMAFYSALMASAYSSLEEHLKKVSGCGAVDGISLTASARAHSVK